MIVSRRHFTVPDSGTPRPARCGAPVALRREASAEAKLLRPTPSTMVKLPPDEDVSIVLHRVRGHGVIGPGKCILKVAIQAAVGIKSRNIRAADTVDASEVSPDEDLAVAPLKAAVQSTAGIESSHGLTCDLPVLFRAELAYDDYFAINLQGHCGSVTRTTRKPRMKSWMNGLTPSVRRRPNRQSASPASQAPPRMTLTPVGFEAGPCGSVANPPGYGPYQS